MAILDGKEYASLQDGRDNTEDEVTKCVLLTNNQVHNPATSVALPVPLGPCVVLADLASCAVLLSLLFDINFVLFHA